MNKWLVSFSLMLLMIRPNPGLPQERRTLAGVFKPEAIRVGGDVLYVVEGATVLVYSLKDGRLVRKIGGPGQGPGELPPVDSWYNTVTVLPEGLFVDGYDKTVLFSKDGRLLKEARKPLGASRMIPVGENFAAVDLDHLEEDVQFQRLLLYDSKGTLLKELARQESPVQSMTRKTEMIPDVLNFAVWDNRIYVERSREGFVLDVFDDHGAFQYRIEKKTKRIAVTKAHQSEAIEQFKTDPFVKQIGFEEFKKFSQFIWPRTLPAIRDLMAADGRIYARTSETRGGKDRWLVMDSKGTTLKSVDLPRVDSAPLMASLCGVNYLAVHDHTFYFLKDNERTDEWELFVEKIKQPQP